MLISSPEAEVTRARSVQPDRQVDPVRVFVTSGRYDRPMVELTELGAVFEGIEVEIDARCEACDAVIVSVVIRPHDVTCGRCGLPVRV